MEETSAKRGWFHTNRKSIAVIVIIFIVVPSVIIIPNLINDNEPEYELSYSLTVWILSLEEEFDLHLDFYSSQQDAEDRVNRLQGIICGISPLADEEHSFPLINLPEDLLGMWVRICLESYDGAPYVVFSSNIGQKTTTSLLGREISILIQPYLG